MSANFVLGGVFGLGRCLLRKAASEVSMWVRLIELTPLESYSPQFQKLFKMRKNVMFARKKGAGVILEDAGGFH